MKDQWKKYIGIGIAVFLTFAACIFLFFAVFERKAITAAIGKALGILEPILIGIVIAYLLNPAMNFFEKRVSLLLGKANMSEKRKRTVTRGAGVVLALLFGLLIVVSVFGLMIPQVIASIYGIAREMPGHINDFSQWVLDISKNNPHLEKAALDIVDKAMGKLNEWFTSDLLIYVSRYLGYVTSGIISAVGTIFNVVIGLIVAIYILYSKETFVGQSKKILYALVEPGKANIILNTARKSHQIFGGFISGKILDSAIIGILCFICLSLMDMPYTLLVSVIVGVTNVIPFFGPYIGAIPSTLIILLASPLQAVYFLIFILILQQIDGNIIGPAILGESTGLSAFWVIFAIMLGGGMFGIAGMIIGVPTFAVIYYIIKTSLEHVLRKKKYPVASSDYVRLKKINRDSHQAVYFEEEELKIRPKFFKLSMKRSNQEDQREKEGEESKK